MAKHKTKPLEAPVELSLDARVALAVAAEMRGERRGLLGQVEIRRPGPIVEPKPALPEQWGIVHVMDRLEEAFTVLRRMPMSVRPRSYANSMPAYRHDNRDRFSQIVGQERDELERQERERNRVRIGASSDQIERMEEALAWAMEILRDKPEIAAAVGYGALWAVQRANVEKRCQVLGMSRRTFRRRQIQGLRLIAIELIRRKVPVT